MNAGQYFVYCLKHTFDYQGRARRAEYGWFLLISIIINLVLGWVQQGTDLALVQIPLGIFSIWLTLSGIAVTARRLHDLGFSGWWQLIPLLPLVLMGVIAWVFKPDVGMIYAILAFLWFAMLLGFQMFILFKSGQPFSNRFGENPKG
ncbi:DUF805 domain-containing protein [Spirabiliibacterium falconis]|uniref:DUF805 domain-containing protein n=1 Tax=Spirabiliibacterium falconis TaxID=572023 RepID=UPI001AACB30D|nr:DUF805 domain-containing protein [Spirabiliibacterium falconis]MBE2895134.1 DUF805 domain-containing protein [Spirabiliibacterium falconis]